jgi:hypothetical protein
MPARRAASSSASSGVWAVPRRREEESVEALEVAVGALDATERLDLVDRGAMAVGREARQRVAMGRRERAPAAVERGDEVRRRARGLAHARLARVQDDDGASSLREPPRRGEPAMPPPTMQTSARALPRSRGAERPPPSSTSMPS